jgi:hypothetical protein
MQLTHAIITGALLIRGKGKVRDPQLLHRNIVKIFFTKIKLLSSTTARDYNPEQNVVHI